MLFTIIIGEFADMATDGFIGFLDRARSSKMGIVVAHQEIADLDRISPFSIRYLEKHDAFLIRMGWVSDLISAKLIRHKLGISYLKKDGAVVKTVESEEYNRRGRKAYARAMVATLKLDEKPLVKF